MKMTMTEDEILGRIKMGVNVDIKRSDGKRFHEFFWYILKFMFSKKAMKIDEIFNVHLTLCSRCQIDCEDFFNFCGSS